MNNAALADWFKNTIPGIIILGALGSVLAAAILWLIGRYLPPMAKRALNRLLTIVVKHFVEPSIAQAIRLHFLRTSNKVQLFYTLQLMKFVLALFVALCGFDVFLFSLSQPYDTFLRAGLLAPLVVSFLGVWYALRCVAIVAVPLFYDVESQIEVAKSEYLSRLPKPPEG